MKKTRIIASLLIAALMVVTLAFAVHAEEGEADLLGTAAPAATVSNEGEGELPTTTEAPDTAVSNDVDGAEPVMVEPATDGAAPEADGTVPDNAAPEADIATPEITPEADTGAPAEDAAKDTEKKNDNSWIIWVVIGIVVVAAIVIIAVKSGKKSK